MARAFTAFVHRDKNNVFIVLIKFAVQCLSTHWFAQIGTVYIRWPVSGTAMLPLKYTQKQRRHGLETQTQEEREKDDCKNERATEKADVSVEQRINVTLGDFTWSLVNLNCFKLRDQIVPLQWSDYLGVLLRYYDIDHLWPPAIAYPYLPAIIMVNLLARLMELAVFLLMVQGAGRDEHRAIIFGH